MSLSLEDPSVVAWIAWERRTEAAMHASLDEAIGFALERWSDDDYGLVVLRDRLAGEISERRAPSPKTKRRIPNALRKAVFERDAYRCRGCGDWHDLTVDHVVAEANGGTDEIDNLQTLCRICNSRKGTS